VDELRLIVQRDQLKQYITVWGGGVCDSSVTQRSHVDCSPLIIVSPTADHAEQLISTHPRVQLIGLRLIIQRDQRYTWMS
jgi:hypothetical protein